MSEVQNEKLAQLYNMARSAKASNDATTAKKYYDMILAEDPLNWEPVFYSVYYTYSTMKNGEIGNKANEIKNCLNTVLLMVEQNTDVEEKNCILLDLKNSIASVGLILQSASINFYNSLPGMTKNPLDKTARAMLIADLLFVMGDGLKNNSLNDNAKEIYKQAISTLEGETVFSINTNNTPPQYLPSLERMTKAADFIRESEPDYKTKRENWKEKQGDKKGGCYVATCVYGSYDCPEVWTLRRFRDNTLGSTWYGRAFIRTYYAISPTIVKWFGNTAWFKKMWRGTLDRMVKKLESNGVENTSYQDKNW